VSHHGTGFGDNDFKGLVACVQELARFVLDGGAIVFKYRHVSGLPYICDALTVAVFRAIDLGARGGLSHHGSARTDRRGAGLRRHVR
jgi:hypothetical protein